MSVSDCLILDSERLLAKHITVEASVLGELPFPVVCRNEGALVSSNSQFTTFMLFAVNKIQYCNDLFAQLYRLNDINIQPSDLIGKYENKTLSLSGAPVHFRCLTRYCGYRFDH